MGTVSINSITINNASGAYGCGPFYNNKTITSIDLGYVPWTNNSMYEAFAFCIKLTSISNNEVYFSSSEFKNLTEISLCSIDLFQ